MVKEEKADANTIFQGDPGFLALLSKCDYHFHIPVSQVSLSVMQALSTSCGSFFHDLAIELTGRCKAIWRHFMLRAIPRRRL
ncbi:hypothetical protein P8631_07495 [Guyparkeria sp. 1SP6A2]|nr:hypothetical protein [Guyparkeria sp. 1SP6A2]